MDTDPSRGTPETFLEAERRVLQVRRKELLPHLAELERVERRLREIDALQAHGTAATAVRGRSSVRQRFSTEARGLQLLDLLTARPGLRRKEIADALDVQVARAGKIVNWLLAQDRLVQDRDGRLYVSPDAEHVRAATDGDSR